VHRELPWRRPRFERTLLALVAAAALLPVYTVNAQDVSRLCLTRALAHGNVANDECLMHAFDRAAYGGHFYSDKAPGMSLLELPSAEALRLRRIEEVEGLDPRLWGVRLLSSGIAFLACAFLVGRLAEGLAPGAGGAALVSFALGTLAMPFAAANFGHVPAAALGFAAFLLAWRRRPGAAGLAAGCATLVEYQAAAILVAVGAYVAARGLRGVARYAAGAAPGLALLLAYDTAAFGAPWRLPYDYIANGYAAEQARGLFGIGVPRLFPSYEVFAGGGGLLVVSPVLAAAGAGLVLLGRRHRAEALLCAAVTAFFVLLNCGYFLPYGGISPGPRFLIPALPFLAAGLGPAFARRPAPTALLAALSVTATTAVTLAWGINPPFHRTIWGELVRLPSDDGAPRFTRNLVGTALGWLGAGRNAGAAAVALAALAAFALAAARLPAPRRATRRPRGLAGVAAVAALVAAAGASAVARYPYGDRVVTTPSSLQTTLSASTTTALPGGEVDFLAQLENPDPTSAMRVVLTIDLPPGLELLGPPWHERGPGCTGTGRISCDLDYLEPGMTTLVRFGTRVEPNADPELEVQAWGSTNGVAARRASLEITTGSS